MDDDHIASASMVKAGTVQDAKAPHNGWSGWDHLYDSYLDVGEMAFY